MTTKTVRVELTGDPSSAVRSLTVVSETAQKTAAKAEGAMTRASSRIGGAFGKLDGLLGQFGVPFTGVLGVLGTKMENFQTKGTTAFAKVQEAGKLAAVGIGAGFAIIGVESVHLADKFEESEARLKTAVKNSGEAWAKAEPAIEKTNKQLENLGFNNTETENSLSRLVTATNSVTTSTKLMSLAADIARARHISLEAATDILVKVEAGRFTVLGRTLGVSKEVVAGLHSTDDAVKLLSDRYQGSAQQAAETFNGKIGVMKAKLEDVGIKIGTFLIPWIERLVGAVQDTITWFEKHKGVAEALAITIGVVLVAAIGTWVASMVAAGITTAIAMAPVTIALALIALAIADGYLLWKKYGDDVVSAIQPAIDVVSTLYNTAKDVLGFLGLIDDSTSRFNANGGVGDKPYGPSTPAGWYPRAAPAPNLSFLNDPNNPYYTNPWSPTYRGYATGGWVQGTGNSDSVPAMLTPGEYVMSRDEVRAERPKGMGGGSRNYHINVTTVQPERAAGEMVRLLRAHESLETL